MELISLVAIVLLLLSYFIYRRVTRKKGKTVPGPGYFRHALNLFTKPMCLIDESAYKKYKDNKVYVVREGFNQNFFISDIDLIRDILIKDFHIFCNHRFIPGGLFELNVFHVRDGDWKRIRSLVSPVFTSSKLRKLTDPINVCIDSFFVCLDNDACSGQAVNIKERFGAFTLDVVTTCAYGIRVDLLATPNHPMLVNARNMMRPTLRIILAVLFPKVFATLGISGFEPNAVKFYSELTRKIIRERQNDNIKHSDFMQLLLEAESDDKDNKSLSIDEITAQGIVFFLAGYETTATTLTYCSYFLAKHPEVQEKLYEEVSKISDNDQDSVQKLEYLECCINETLRIFPPLCRMEREVKQNYELGDTGVILPAGSLVIIPSYAIQRDSIHFENPEAFVPERFVDGLSASKLYSFHPFGLGPRQCVGMRFAIIEVKMCLARMVKRYRFKLSSETKVEHLVGNMLTAPKEMYLHIEKRE